TPERETGLVITGIHPVQIDLRPGDVAGDQPSRLGRRHEDQARRVSQRTGARGNKDVDERTRGAVVPEHLVGAAGAADVEVAIGTEGQAVGRIQSPAARGHKDIDEGAGSPIVTEYLI